MPLTPQDIQSNKMQEIANIEKDATEKEKRKYVKNCENNEFN